MPEQAKSNLCLCFLASKRKGLWEEPMASWSCPTRISCNVEWRQTLGSARRSRRGEMPSTVKSLYLGPNSDLSRFDFVFRDCKSTVAELRVEKFLGEKQKHQNKDTCKRLVESTGIYVQYGCGMSCPDTWVNFDASPRLRLQRLPVLGSMFRWGPVVFPRIVRYGDIVKGLPVLAGSAAGVHASHSP
jgi:hypothetical protein